MNAPLLIVDPHCSETFYLDVPHRLGQNGGQSKKPLGLLLVGLLLASYSLAVALFWLLEHVIQMQDDMLMTRVVYDYIPRLVSGALFLHMALGLCTVGTLKAEKGMRISLVGNI